ncbi:MAG: isochorismatase family protein [Planctomycetes bacterium]|jgi:nicotinamidase-related amidase|nr:isochorismatase family protein [Phycisphaerae bacterium]NBB94625.1 isochorismatase family protein [Planctomycetota bacterium]
MLKAKNTALVLIDVQQKLFEHIHDQQRLLASLVRVVKGAQLLELPIIWCEQMPEKLGPTIEPLAECLGDDEPITKTTFCCCGARKFEQALLHSGAKSILLAGIETHVCVYQTAACLADDAYDVQVLADCTSSRTAENHEIGLGRIQTSGATLTSVEMAMLELLQDAASPLFKDMLRLIKSP